MTVEQFGRHFMTERAWSSTGTPKQIADELENCTSKAAPMAASCWRRAFQRPAYLREFVERVVPELQRRGLAQTRYAATTLRDNLAN